MSSPITATTVIDVHAHAITEEAFKALAKDAPSIRLKLTDIDDKSLILEIGGVVQNPFPRSAMNLDLRFEDLRSAGIDMQLVSPSPHFFLYDGDNGMGHLVMYRAADTAIELAREAGIGWVGVRRSNHAGPASLYATMPIEHGMIGIYSAVASANHMAIWGGSEPLLGTNPLAIGIPAGDLAPVVLDIATTMVSYGTIKSYALNGRTLPKGWLIERTTGQPLTDPKRSSEGLLEPIGGYKGSGLALVLGILAGVLNGAAFGRDVIDFNADSSSETNTGHFILAIDVKRFQPLAAFQSELDRQLASLQESRTMPGFEAIRLPGAERVRRVAERSKSGVPIAAALVTALDQLAVDLNLSVLSGRA